MTASSVQPNRNAGKGPNASSSQVKMPPERGTAPASSATVSAPHSAITPPNTQHRMTEPGECNCAATAAGTRKIPLPMVRPTRTATASTKPTLRGMRSPHWSACTVPSRALVSDIHYRSRCSHAGLERRLRPYAITPTTLGRVKRGVGTLEHGAGRVPAWHRHRDADTTGYRALVIEPARCIDGLDPVAQTLCYRAGFGEPGSRQHDEKLLSAEPPEK